MKDHSSALRKGPAKVATGEHVHVVVEADEDAPAGIELGAVRGDEGADLAVGRVDGADSVSVSVSAASS